MIVCSDFRDFLDNLPAGSVDFVLTDPPYAISKETGFKNVVKWDERFAVETDYGKWDHQEVDINRLATACYRALRRGGSIVVWYDLWKVNRMADALRNAGFKMLRTIFWEKKNPVPMNMKFTYLSNGREAAVSAVKHGKPTFNAKYHRGMYHYPIPRHGGRRIHPTQKPVDLFSELVRVHTDPGDLVVDPFVGSGTTAVAALEQGRRFKGCDIDPQYASAAKARIDE